MKKIFFMALSVFLVSFSQANAEDFGKDWYVGGEFATIDQKYDDLRVFEDGVNWTSSYDLMDQLDSHSFGLLAGRKFDNGLRLEAKYNYIFSEEEEGLDNIIQTNHIKLETDIHKLVASLYYDYALPKGVTIFGGAGIGGAYVIPKSSVYNGTENWGFMDKDDPSFAFVWEVSAGLSYMIKNSIDLTFQYTYSDLGNVDWANVGKNGPGETALFEGDADIKLNSFSLGIRYFF